MNLAEIRKKSKQKRTEADVKPSTPELPKKQDEALPAVSPANAPAEQAQALLPETAQLIDEETFYISRTREESAELNEFLCFRLGNEEYAVDIRFSKEIIRKKSLTEVPKVPEFILGVIAMRGEVIPVFDIKKLLGIEEAAPSLRARLVLIKYENDSSAILVDEVTQITKIAVESIESTPINISGAKQEFIRGVAMANNRMIRILDIEKILIF